MMKTIRQAIKERGPNWGGMFEALHWSKTEGYYFAKADYCLGEFLCFQDEYEAVAKEISTDAHKRNTALTVELNELCQQHDIGKIGESVLPALKHYIEQSREFYQTTERLLINEIGDFFSAHGVMLTVPQAHQELVTRVQRVFTLVKLQAQHKPAEPICAGITDGFGTRDTCKKCAKFKPELVEACTNPVNHDICRWRILGKCFVQFKAKDDKQ